MTPAQPPLPGYRPLEGLILVVTFFGCCFGIPAILGDRIGFLFAAIFGFVVSVIALAIISGSFLKRRRAAEGLIPDMPGAAGQISLLARKFRERADQIEQAMRWGKDEVPAPGWETRKLFEEVHAMVHAAGLPFLRGFDFAVPDERYAHVAGVNDDLRAALEVRQHQLRSRADQLDEFAKTVRGGQPATAP